MKAKSFTIILTVLTALFVYAAFASEQDAKSTMLLPPQTESGMPLMQALKNRQTSRSFSSQELPKQVLSDLLWAAFGINREDSGKRTAPSARNWQEIDIYVAMTNGLYLYNAKDHSLEPILSEDIREKTGGQPFVKDAPVNLVYVANFTKMGRSSQEDKLIYSAADTGFISQNVYLFCASEGLATVVRGSVDRDALHKTMKLRPDQRIVLAQTVGYSKK
jgi:SagB-type dehydrogenase family enzyme